MPKLSCLVNAGGYADNGYYAEDGSSGIVSQNAGVTYAGFHGCYANSTSSIVCPSSIFTNCSQTAPLYSGILAWASTIDAYGADVSGSLYYGAQAAAGGVLYFRTGIADNCARHGIRATNGATTIARDAFARNSGVSGIRSFDCSNVHAEGVNVDGSATGLWCDNTSKIHAANASVDNCTAGAVFCDNMSIINLESASIDNSTDNAISCNNMSKIYGLSATVSSNNAFAFNVDNNSEVSFPLAVITSGPASTAAIDSRTNSRGNFRGATINAGTGRLATLRDGGEIDLTSLTTPAYGAEAVYFEEGGYCKVNGSGILAGEISGGVFNAISASGICYG